MVRIPRKTRAAASDAATAEVDSGDEPALAPKGAQDAAFQIPKADMSPVLFSYLCFLSVDGVAKDTIVVTGLVGRCRMPNAEDWPTRM